MTATSKQLRDTRLIELVETHNLALSLNRLRDATPYDGERYKRALYHAVCMVDLPDQVIEKIRVALELP